MLFNYGYVLFLAERYAEAAQRLEKVIAADPRDGQAYFLLAKTQERAGHPEPATAADNQARRYMEGGYAKWQTEWQKSQTVPNVGAAVTRRAQSDRCCHGDRTHQLMRQKRTILKRHLTRFASCISKAATTKQ